MTGKTITIMRDEDLDRNLNRMANETGHNAPEIGVEALVDWLEDRENPREALGILSRNEPASTSDEVKKRIDLES